MMLLHSKHMMLAIILLLLPLVIGLPQVIGGAMTRGRRLREGATAEEAMQPEQKRFHALGIMEGISFLLLMGVAVPLKRITGEPLWVTVVGSLHGSLFLLYVLATFLIAPALRWRPLMTLLALVASVVPFGPFVFEAYRLKQEKRSVTTS